MRHGRKVNHLGRTSAHRKALMKNMAIALLISPKKRIFTTVAKAKSLRQYVEPLITRGKDNTTHSRRMAFSYLQNKDAVKELFGQVAAKVGDRPGGYTRILKIGARKGDNAEMALIELVDFNEFITEKPKKKSSRRRKKTTTAAAKPAAEVTKVDVAKVEPVAPVVEDPTAEADAPATEETAGDAE